MISGTVVESKEVAAQLPYGMADGWMDGWMAVTMANRGHVPSQGSSMGWVICNHAILSSAPIQILPIPISSPPIPPSTTGG